MILFFDIKKLEEQALGSDVELLKILKDFYNKKVNKQSTLSRYKSINGKSYLLNTQALFNLSIDISYIAQYIRLAARRDYTLYKLFNTISLDLSFYPEIDINIVKSNPLLKITNKQINFKFEEIYYGAKFR